MDTCRLEEGGFTLQDATPAFCGLVSNVKDWPYSKFHRYLKAGVYDENWGVGLDFLDGEFGDG